MQTAGLAAETDHAFVQVAFLAEDAADSASAERENGLIELLVEMRAKARENEYWDEADRIRDQLVELGVILEDRSDGTAWRIVG